MGHYNILQLNQLALWGSWNVLKCVEMCWNVLKCVEMCWNVLKCVEMCWNVCVCVCWPLAKAGQNWQLVDEQNLSCAFAAFFKASYSWLNTNPQCTIHGPKTIQIKMIPRLFGNIGIQWKPIETTGIFARSCASFCTFSSFFAAFFSFLAAFLGGT